MKEYTGEKRLQAAAGNGEARGVYKVGERVWFIAGFGASNATLIEGEHSCTLVDSLNDSKMAELALAELGELLAAKPVHTLIYTHQHPDHTGGAGVLAAGARQVIARRPDVPTYGRSGQLGRIGGLRGDRQWGFSLTPEEAISMGAGPLGERGGKPCPLPVTRWMEGTELALDLDGVPAVLLAAQGETDDQTYLWLPEDRVVCCGDNYYQSWPNTAPIRGGQYRDVAAWVRSLDKLLTLPAEHLLPGHTRALHGTAAIREEIALYRDALSWVLDETLRLLDEGLTFDQVAAAVALPERWRGQPALDEFYGSVAWTVRGICAGYLGWFDGDPADLSPLAPDDRARREVALMGGAGQVSAAAAQALAAGECRWALELCRKLRLAGAESGDSLATCRQALTELGRQDENACARHYFLTCAQELEG